MCLMMARSHYREDNKNMTKAVEKRNEVKTLVKQYEKQFASVLPKIVTAERFTRVILTAMIKTPGLYDCTQESLIQSCLDCASYGLEPDGRMAHLIPYKTTCTLIVDYKGLVELAYRSGQVAMIQGDWVCENDEFEENLGEVIKHVIDRRKDRGEAYAVYTRVKLKNGAESFRIMSKSEVEEVRDKHSAGYRNKKSSSPWTTSPRAMWLKTCFRDHSKWIPSSPELRDVLANDGDMINITPDVDVGAPKTIDVGEPDVPAASGKPANKKKATAGNKSKPEPKPDPEEKPEGDPLDKPGGGFDPDEWNPGAE